MIYWISMQEDPPAGLYAWIIDIIAKKAPGGPLGTIYMLLMAVDLTTYLFTLKIFDNKYIVKNPKIENLKT